MGTGSTFGDLGVARMDHDASGEARTADGHESTGPTGSLLDGLAQAMHTALRREREHIDDIVASDARVHTDKVRARAALEAAELRRMADDEVSQIEAWKAGEVKRIRREAARRTKERRADMASFLERHDRIIETEIAGLEAAVVDYSATLATFVDNLSATEDPGEIARRADFVPSPPDMDDVRARARAKAMAALDQVAFDVPDDGPTAEETGPVDVEPATPPASEPASDPGVAVMEPVAVDPVQVPHDDPVAAAEATKPDEEAAEANGRPTGGFRFLRAFVPWSPASDAPKAEEREARQS
jgi:hypothetical protein